MDIDAMIKERKLVWVALANFYLDTTLHDDELRQIVKIFKNSSYTLEEIKTINRFEIRPVIGGDVVIPHETWRGFNEEWLIKNASGYLTVSRKSNMVSDFLYDFFKSSNWQRMELIYHGQPTVQ